MEVFKPVKIPVHAPSAWGSEKQPSNSAAGSIPPASYDHPSLPGNKLSYFHLGLQGHFCYSWVHTGRAL